MKVIIRVIISMMLIIMSSKDSINYLTIKKNNNAIAILQIINQTEGIVDESITVKNGDLVILHDKEFYECGVDSNDIHIISINDDYVRISRDKIIHDLNNNELITKKIVEDIKYEEPFATSINEIRYGPACSAARYHYQLKFLKSS